MKVLGVIPARYASRRFPGKVLALLNGRPLIQHVYEQVRQARRLDELVVATDDERILQAATRFGARAVMTSPTHRSGTDRIAEVARTLQADIIINIQADEPLIRPDSIDQVVEFLLAHRAVPMTTLMSQLTRREAVANPHVVKVVVDQDGYALYFSRAPIPHIRQDVRGSGVGAEPSAQSPQPLAYKHIGLYGYQREFLLRVPHLSPTPLEQAEQLEQLRALEHGYRIKVLESPYDTVGVDTPEDLATVEARLAQEGLRA
jgi:3-deoxy-manno-octulosonate cytidylyltransferase (CMP-KDO synthetase)